MNIVTQVLRLRRRLLAERTTTWAARAALVTAPFWAAGLIAAGPQVGLSELAIACLLAAAAAWRTSKDAAATAAHVDAALQLDDRVLTAWGTPHDSSPMARLVHADAVRAWRISDPAPLRPRWPWLATGGVVAIAAAAAVYHVQMPGGTAGVLAVRTGSSRAEALEGGAASPAGPVAPAVVAQAARKPSAGYRATPAGPGSGGEVTSPSPSGVARELPSQAPGSTSPLALNPSAGAAAVESEQGDAGADAGPDGAAVGSARQALQGLPERYRPVIMRYLAVDP